MEPFHDPITDSIYVSDGWGTPFRSLKLRRLDARTGAEISAIRLNNAVRTSCYLDDQMLLVALDTRLVALDRHTLTQTERWDKRVPRYTSDMISFDRTVLLMNFLGPSLNAISLDSGRISRTKVGSCAGMHVFGNQAIICNGKEGAIRLCEGHKILATWGVPPFKATAYSPVDQILALALGDPFTLTPDSFRSYPLSRTVCLFSMVGTHDRRDFQAPSDFFAHAFSTDGRSLYLADNRQVTTVAVDDGSHQVRGMTRFRRRYGRVTILPTAGLIVCGSDDEHAVLEAYRIESY
jgi:hypothetical protein